MRSNYRLSGTVSWLVAAMSTGLISTVPCRAGELVYGVTDQNTLLSWDASDPTAILSSVPLQGLNFEERVLGIDFRPANGQLYGLGDYNRLFTINTTSGLISEVATFNHILEGTSFGFDFNPNIDRIRVISDADQNLVLHPDTGQSTGAPTTTSLFYGPGDPNEGTDPNSVHAAYTNNFDGAKTTQLYTIDFALDILTTQNNNGGMLGTVGPLGFDITDVGGFDISSVVGDIAYGAFMLSGTAGNGNTAWFTLDLDTGAATYSNDIGGGGVVVTAMSVAVIPGPGGLAFLSFGGLFATRRGRRRRD